jgi:ABC-2 type transport system ATP-binding protein
LNSYPAIEAIDVSFIYPPAKSGGEPFPALRGISFSVAGGEIFGLLGPNGGGKTTLFRIMATLVVPSKGRLSIAGLDVCARAHEVRKVIGVAFQSPSLDRKLTAEENLQHQGRRWSLLS